MMISVGGHVMQLLSGRDIVQVLYSACTVCFALSSAQITGHLGNRGVALKVCPAVLTGLPRLNCSMKTRDG